ASRQRKVCRARSLASGKPCEKGTVFVIGMRTGMKNAGNDVETLERLRQSRRAAILGDFGCGRNDRACRRKKRDKQNEKELYSAGCHRFAELYYMPVGRGESASLRIGI